MSVMLFSYAGNIFSYVGKISRMLVVFSGMLMILHFLYGGKWQETTFYKYTFYHSFDLNDNNRLHMKDA